ncbi:hypothetical protein [Tropicimonas sp. IMCC6043]|uniref:hypothetical protein n=1 Tax=Tropicimonas sp. IMCC6043 TaxID=2510645 RepID=UPI00101C0498|nr:hypothetical protein [Tropicimonas sp. IMCC6043]RYH09812.1 hypothetical protein EU800_11265 [Tropicimonas sp. IMCC6043]
MADTAVTEGAIHLPPYVAVPGQTDVLFVVVVISVVLMILALGIFYFKLHALPEQMAHEGGHTHMQLVAILAVVALFTHNNIFWIAALLLAAIELPQYERHFISMSESLARIARRAGDGPPEAGARAPEPAAAPQEAAPAAPDATGREA